MNIKIRGVLLVKTESALLFFLAKNLDGYWIAYNKRGDGDHYDKNNRQRDIVIN